MQISVTDEMRAANRRLRTVTAALSQPRQLDLTRPTDLDPFAGLDLDLTDTGGVR